MYKILIADDEELEREALRFFINESSLDIDQVIECASGTEVIKRVMLDRPDIIVLDINMPGLMESGLNMAWVDAAEGSFAAPATINVVKGCQNPELAQLFVEYMISDETQSKVAEAMNEAPVNKNATMPDELKTYLAFGEDAMSSLKEFDETYISQAKEEWIDTFQRTVAVQ